MPSLLVLAGHDTPPGGKGKHRRTVGKTLAQSVIGLLNAAKGE
jgi:hypothetical protein